MASVLALSCMLLFSNLVDAQVHVMSPHWLKNALMSTNGRIDGSTATFGAPFYGDRVLGRLVWGESKKGQHHCTDEDYDVPVPDVQHGVRLIDIFIVHRGECSFVTKVRVASKKGAHAVIFVDRPDSGLTTSDLQNIVVADDGWGSAVHIPSVLVTRDHGEQLIAAAKGGEAVVELAWDVPTNHVVKVDMWMSSGAADSMSFIESFAESRKVLNEVVDFQPHYDVFSMDSTQGGYNGLCSDETAEYCAEDPDKSGPVTGRDVLDEDVRQLCIHEITKVPRVRSASEPSHSRHVVFFADEWWNYMRRLSTRCPMDAAKEQDRFGAQCSEQLMREVGIDVAKVKKCVRETAHQKLAKERENKAWSSHAVRINGWRYNGMLNADLVTRAVCSGFAVRPKECSDLIEPRDPFAKFGEARAQGIGFGSFMGILSCAVLAACVGMVLYRRFLAKTIRAQMREEVMLEVHAQLDAYSKLPASV